MRRMSMYHESQLEREPVEKEPEPDYERESRIEAEAYHVTTPEDLR